MLCSTGLNAFVSKVSAAGTTNVTAQIEWDDGDDADGLRPQSVQVELFQYWDNYRFDTPYEDEVAVLNAANGWKYTYSNLPLSVGGEKVSYILGNSNLYSIENYGKPEVARSGNTWTLTYTHTPTTTPPVEPEPEPNTTQVTVRIVWNDGGNVDGLRPKSIGVGLVKDWGGYFEELTEYTVREEDEWTYTWSNLPLEEDGVSITYSVRGLSYGTDYEAPVVTND